jgi:hypothetical protein
MLSCEPTGTSTITVRWGWSKAPIDGGHGGGYLGYAPQSMTLTRTSPSAKTLINSESVSVLPGSFEDKGLSTSTTYTYKLDIRYTSKSYTTSTQVVGCNIPVSLSSSDTPSKLKAFATDMTTIYVNWKDNATTTKKAYRFNLQRIKLTPASSTELKVTNADDSSISLSWKNNTTSTPYFNWIERSTSTTNRFQNYPAPNDTNNDKGMVKLESSGSTSPSDGLKSFSLSDSGLQDATTYYYRVKACSTYKDGSLTESYKNEKIDGDTEKPNPACGKYAPDPDKAMVPPNLYGGGTPSVATTTLPKTPTEATSTASYNKSTGVHSITLRWNDNSKRETGYRIWRNGILIDERSYNTNATGVLTHVDVSGNNNKDNSALNEGNFYNYEIQGYYDIPAENGGGGGARVYSKLATTGTHTYFKITTDVVDDGTGTISGPGDLNGCTTSCAEFFPWDTTKEIGLSESPDSDYEFVSWSGVSCKEGNDFGSNCTVVGPGNRYITGTFRRVVFGLTATDPGTKGNISGSGINCGNGVLVCNTSARKGDSISLSATPASGYSFNSWSGSCSSSGSNPSCSFTMPGNNAMVGASFSQSSFQLSIGISQPYATGTVSSNPGNINCSCDGGGHCIPPCSGSFNDGTRVTLTATPGAGAKFVSWSGGGCSGSASTCDVVMSGNITVFAKFASTDVGGGLYKKSFFADLWSNARYLWKGLFEDRSKDRVSALSASFADIMDGVKSGWQDISSLFSQMMKQAEFAVEQAALKTAKVAEGQSTGNPLDVYFKSIATTTASAHIDKNLEPDIVYLYRVRLIYDNEPTQEIRWSNSGATKTFRDTNGGSITNRGVCTRNSYCDFSGTSYQSSVDVNKKPNKEHTEQQCQTNVECKNVGRYGQAFQER